MQKLEVERKDVVVTCWTVLLRTTMVMTMNLATDKIH